MDKYPLLLVLGDEFWAVAEYGELLLASVPYFRQRTGWKCDSLFPPPKEKDRTKVDKEKTGEEVPRVNDEVKGAADDDKKEVVVEDDTGNKKRGCWCFKRH